MQILPVFVYLKKAHTYEDNFHSCYWAVRPNVQIANVQKNY